MILGAIPWLLRIGGRAFGRQGQMRSALDLQGVVEHAEHGILAEVHALDVFAQGLGAARRAEAQARFGDPERWRELTANMPFGRAATPKEIGNAVAFLASAEAKYITGQCLTVDGGMVM